VFSSDIIYTMYKVQGLLHSGASKNPNIFFEVQTKAIG